MVTPRSAASSRGWSTFGTVWEVTAQRVRSWREGHIGPAGANGLGRVRPIRRLALVWLTALALVLTACSGNGDGDEGGAGARGDVLTVGNPFAPTPNLDPAQAGGGFIWYSGLAYDPLIYVNGDGVLEPRLAASWEYLDDKNMEFELKLRPDVKFSDGSAFTADVVKRNVEYFASAGGESAGALANITEVTAVDDLTVRMTLATPNPMMPEQFTQTQLAGFMISPKALENPKTLETETFGAGPYVLDGAQTVPNDHYTYVPNPEYWNPDDIHYKKVVIKVLPNPNTALSALRSGQVDVIAGDLTQVVDTAEDAGLNIASAHQPFWGLALADRAGDIVPALGDPRVRQALNYAINRQSITDGLFGKWGKPTDQIVLPGIQGYNDRTFYEYDPDRAKALLAEAGYPDGFELSVLGIETLSLMTQAIADDLSKIGVDVKIANRGDATTYVTDLQSGKFPAYAIGYGTMPPYFLGQRLFLPDAGLFNPLESSDQQIEDWYAEAAQSTGEEQDELYRQIIARLAEQGWFVPVSFVSLFTISSPDVAGVEMSDGRPYALPNEFHPADGSDG